MLFDRKETVDRPFKVPDSFREFNALRCASGYSRNSGLVLLLVLLLGCAPAISPQIRKEAAVDIPFGEVLRDPERYVGKTFIWGGTILEARNTLEGTMLKVLQRPMDSQSRPKEVDRSEGRFLALDKRYLDPAIYAEGRAVTVAGELVGKRVLPLGDIDYAYPLLAVREIYLWPKEPPTPYYYYPYYYPYPYWGWRYYWWP
jgi:outer membrane lipoprotein